MAQGGWRAAWRIALAAVLVLVIAGSIAEAAGRRHHRARHAPPPRALPTVVVDPGHGGKDGGAIGRSGTLEKNVTLATARELRRLLLASGRYHVVMTRSTDVFVPLRRRVAAAHRGALFVSIHADSSPNRRAHGASVYTRSSRSRGSRVAALPADPASAGAIGRALAGAADRPGSALLQYVLLDELGDDVRLNQAPARQGHLYVLGARETPSVLLEMGFLSNRKDEAALRQPRRRAAIARAIRDAIDQYFLQIRRTNSRT